MATTTPNYGWTVPTSTDLVKDGATAIETLGDAIDASMNTALGTKKAGMVLLQSVAFSGVASYSLPADTFNSTYDNYVLFSKITSSSNATIQMRLRTATDNSTLFYDFAVPGIQTNGTASNLLGTLQSAWSIGSVFATANAVFRLELYTPNIATRTYFTSQFMGILGSSTLRTSNSGGGEFQDTNAFTSATLFASAGNITGSISVYGYNK